MLLVRGAMDSCNIYMLSVLEKMQIDLILNS